MTVRLPRLLGSLLVFGFFVASHPASQGAVTIGGYQIVKQTRIRASGVGNHCPGHALQRRRRAVGCD
jgi:hypothetical protein